MSEVLTWLLHCYNRDMLIPSRVNCREWFHTTKRIIAHNYSLLLVSEVLTYYCIVTIATCHSFTGELSRMIPYNKKNHSAQLLALLVSEVLTYYCIVTIATCHSFTGELSRMIPYNKKNIAHNYSLLLVSEVLTYYCIVTIATCHSFTG